MSLGPRRRRAFDALADVLLPDGGRIEMGAVEAGVTERLDRALSSFPPRQRRLLRALISAWDLAPLGAPSYRRRFHRLTPKRRREWVARVQRSRRRDLKAGLYYLKQLVFLFYASTPEVETLIGFDYTCRRDSEVHGRGPQTAE